MLNYGNISSNLKCSECSNIKMLGIKFESASKNIEDIIYIFSSCIHKHPNENKLIEKISLNDLFIKDNDINSKCTSNIKCEYCKEKPIQYYCLECKRNICLNCFKFHKTHKFYYDKDYISQKELEDIENNFDESKKTLKINLKLIENQIHKFESQLDELKLSHEKHKNINDKLIKFSEYILNKYANLVKSEESISYPIYFNVKNVLLFNPYKINLPENDISIKSFIDTLNEKLCSGFYFVIMNSVFSDNLFDYNKLDKEIHNHNIIDINKYQKNELLYIKIVYFNKDKILGIDYKFEFQEKSNKEEIKERTCIKVYNIKNKCVESLILMDYPDKIYCSNEYNLLILESDSILTILNSINFSKITKISAEHD